MNYHCSCLLNLLETKEVELLAWGIVDGGFSESEVLQHAEAILSEHGGDFTADELVSRAIDVKVLFELSLSGRRLFRTRMGESVRLFARLRQWFPSKNWRVAPTLVADFRFCVRPRAYPRRDIVPEAFRQALQLLPRYQPYMRTLLEHPRRPGYAQFQRDATRRILSDLLGRFSRGTIICAGTGTGKTLAFYLPALSHVAASLDATNWTKVLALYPRNELLKDQFSETYGEVRRMDPQTRRKITIGAYYGSTPTSASVSAVEDNWNAKGSGFVCPYMRCPLCGQELIWDTVDIQRNHERLHCVQSGCVGGTLPDEVMLTRRRMESTPPDLVFTTTEMLNRKMSDPRNGQVFGIGSRTRKPDMMLLDEVHTYTGVHGAQVGLLLRRWRNALGTRVAFVGLSATLKDAPTFFSQLTGLSAGAVLEVSPLGDLINEGAEYMLALRGDPVSRTSLLSTTIQASMLLRRIMDPSNDECGDRHFGSRVFIFTDDLDVTNRLYHNLQDAEGRDGYRRPLPKREPLAALRSRQRAENPERLLFGQSWQLCEEIGHTEGLTDKLDITRTTSQDPGVDGGDIVVATASLEVGFNDPSVGAIIQHKAPRNPAAFLQRKGRAGRRREIRPWTVVTLSDYGRDRLAYQRYEQLFDPVLDFNALPIKNRYVLRIQAAFAFMDWVGLRLDSNLPGGKVWYNFAGPAENGPYRDSTQRRQQAQAQLIRAVLESESVQQELEDYLSKALDISSEELRPLLWEPPRALLTSVLPTLLRRLETGWSRIPRAPGETTCDYRVQGQPLPEFVTANLFSDLNLPDVWIVPQSRRGNADGEGLSIGQSLVIFAPGRVTRRFAAYDAHGSHWVALPNLTQVDQTLAVNSYCAEYEELARISHRCG